jgi:hypothetical protein
MLHFPEGILGSSAMSALWQEHGLGREGSWKAVVACGHIFGQDATTGSTQGHNIIWESRSFVGQGGEAGKK